MISSLKSLDQNTGINVLLREKVNILIITNDLSNACDNHVYLSVFYMRITCDSNLMLMLPHTSD